MRTEDGEGKSDTEVRNREWSLGVGVEGGAVRNGATFRENALFLNFRSAIHSREKRKTPNRRPFLCLYGEMTLETEV